MERIADVEKVLMNEIDNLHGVYLYLVISRRRFMVRV